MTVFRKIARLFRSENVTPAELVSRAVSAMESSKEQMERGGESKIHDEYLITLAGSAYDQYSCMLDTLKCQIESQMKAYALDMGLQLNRQRLSVHIARMPASRKGDILVESWFSPETDLSADQQTTPLDQVAMHFDGDDRTMVFGRMKHRDKWCENYGLRKDEDMSNLVECIQWLEGNMIDDGRKLLQPVLKHNPAHIGAWILNDYIATLHGDDTALERLRSRAILVKDDPLLSSALALMLLREGDPESAMWELLEALNHAPGNSLLMLLLAEAYHSMHMDNLAAETAGRIAGIDANEPDVRDAIRRYHTRNAVPVPPSEKPRRGYTLRLYDQDQPGYAGKVVRDNVRKATFVIGRANSGLMPDLELNDNLISSNHCQIVNSGGTFFIIDSDSRNGVFVNKKREKTTGLKNGDIIRLGNTRLVFEC